jgi:hypothetical protein
MFALVAAVLWFIAAVFGASLGGISLLYLGLGFLALHFAFGSGPLWIPRRRA